MAGTRDDFSSASSSRRFADGSTVRSISDGPARSECPAGSRFLSERRRIPGLAVGRLFGFSVIGSPDGASRHTNRFRRTGSLAKDAVHLAAGILFLDVLALVVAFASLGQSDLQLGQSPLVDEQLQPDDG